MESKGIEILANPYGRKLTEQEIISHLNGVDGLLAGLEPLNENVFKSCTQLKAIARVGIGMDNVDINAAKKFGILISNTPNAPTSAVAEMTLAVALNLTRLIIPANKALHNKTWSKLLGQGLINSNVFIVGYGSIGKKVSELLNVFKANVMVYDPVVNKDHLKFNEKLVEFETGLKTADIISLHVSGNQCILTSKDFQLMKDGVIILNSARGNLIDENALIDALESGKVSSAWLDVFWNEPYTGKLTEYNQVILTPHMSTYSVQCRNDMEMAAVKNLLIDLGIK